MRRLAVVMMAAVAAALAATPDRIENIKYISGLPGYTDELGGALELSSSGLVFESRGRRRVKLESVDYVAAQGRVGSRALSAQIGSGIAFRLTEIGVYSAIDTVTSSGFLAGMSRMGIPLLAAAPFVVILREKRRYLFSVEYEEDKTGLRRFVLFRSRKNSATAVKRIIDEALGLTAEHYSKKDLEEESRLRKLEHRLEPSGSWEPVRNTLVGDAKWGRILVESGTYDVLLSYGYIGLRQQGGSWAKYRLPIRNIEPSEHSLPSVNPIYEGGRLVGFEVDGLRRHFY